MKIFHCASCACSPYDSKVISKNFCTSIKGFIESSQTSSTDVTPFPLSDELYWVRLHSADMDNCPNNIVKSEAYSKEDKSAIEGAAIAGAVLGSLSFILACVAVAAFFVIPKRQATDVQMNKEKDKATTYT